MRAGLALGGDTQRKRSVCAKKLEEVLIKLTVKMGTPEEVVSNEMTWYLFTAMLMLSLFHMEFL